MKQLPKKHRYLFPAIAAAITLAMVAGAHGYRARGEASMQGATAQLGTVFLAQAARFEAAGDLETAMAFYERALAGTLAGQQDQTHAQKRCGVILWKQRNYATALPYLRAAQESPLRSLNGYRPLVESLIAEGQFSEAETFSARWREEAANSYAQLADALHAHGRLAVHRDDLVSAIAHFEAAIQRVPTHRAHIDLARIHLNQNAPEKAHDLLITFLSMATPGSDANEARGLLRELVQENTF